MERLGRNMSQSGIDANNKVIMAALTVAEIPVQHREHTSFNDEVSATAYGRLGPFEFCRKAAMWRVNGNMPLDVARMMRNSPDCHHVVWSEPVNGKPYVETFAVMEDAGLILIANTIREHGLA